MAFLSEVETISPGFAVPEASTTSLVLPPDEGLNGAGLDEPPARSQGFGGGLLAAKKYYSFKHLPNSKGKISHIIFYM